MKLRTRIAKGRLAVMVASFAVAIGALTSSCAGASAGLGTSSSTCFSALPASFGAVGHHSRLLGVRLLPATKIRRFIPDLPASKGGDLCVLAFQLPDSRGQFVVKKFDDRIEGKFELVIYSLATKKVLTTRRRPALPIRFAHAFSIV